MRYFGFLALLAGTIAFTGCQKGLLNEMNDKLDNIQQDLNLIKADIKLNITQTELAVKRANENLALNQSQSQALEFSLTEIGRLTDMVEQLASEMAQNGENIGDALDRLETTNSLLVTITQMLESSNNISDARFELIMELLQSMETELADCALPVCTVAPDKISPVFEGADDNGDGTFTLRFGYLNRNEGCRVAIPQGSSNKLTGTKENPQTVSFLPGRQIDAFSLVVDAGTTIVWTLKSPNGKTSTSTGTAK